MKKSRKKLVIEESNYLKTLENKLLDVDIKTEFSKAAEWSYYRSESYRTLEYWLHWGQIGISFVISALGAIETLQGNWLGIVIIIISLISPVLTGIKSKHKSLENWRRYRDELEDLKSLTRKYLYEIEPFKPNDSASNKKLYLLLLDNIITKETSGWQTMREKNEQVQYNSNE